MFPTDWISAIYKKLKKDTSLAPSLEKDDNLHRMNEILTQYATSENDNHEIGALADLLFTSAYLIMEKGYKINDVMHECVKSRLEINGKLPDYSNYKMEA